MAEFVDKNGNVLTPVLSNTAKDGSGTDLIPIVDSDGHLQVDSLSGGGTQYAEDAAHASGNTGTLALVVRQDAAAQLAGADGDYSALINDASGRLHVLDANSAAIKTAVELIDNAISSTEMQVDVVAALPAGTNAIGKLAANSGVDIGDVDVLTEPSGSGAYTTPTHTAPSIGATTTVALALNANRLYALLINDSDAVIYIKLGADAVMNQGIRLNASGGSYEMSKKLGNLYTGAINGISAAGSKILLVLEGV